MLQAVPKGNHVRTGLPQAALRLCYALNLIASRSSYRFGSAPLMLPRAD